MGCFFLSGPTFLLSSLITGCKFTIQDFSVPYVHWLAMTHRFPLLPIFKNDAECLLVLHDNLMTIHLSIYICLYIYSPIMGPKGHLYILYDHITMYNLKHIVSTSNGAIHASWIFMQKNTKLQLCERETGS